MHLSFLGRPNAEHATDVCRWTGLVEEVDWDGTDCYAAHSRHEVGRDGQAVL